MFPFHALLRMVQNPFPLVAQACIPPFEKNSNRKVNHLYKYILEWLHEHTFFSIILSMTYDPHHKCLELYKDLGFRVWISTCLVIPSFYKAFDIFSTTLRTRLGYPHPMIIGFVHCIYGQPINAMGIHLLWCVTWRGTYYFLRCHFRCLCFHC
jgi:hypothetical protein